MSEKYGIAVLVHRDLAPVVGWALLDEEIDAKIDMLSRLGVRSTGLVERIPPTQGYNTDGTLSDSYLVYASIIYLELPSNMTMEAIDIAMSER